MTGGPMYGQGLLEGEFGGATLWNMPNLYLENSPIFKLDRVTTPILTMNNPKDPLVPYTQGIEFFTGLRRLGKKAWMLQYEKRGPWGGPN